MQRRTARSEPNRNVAVAANFGLTSRRRQSGSTIDVQGRRLVERAPHVSIAGLRDALSWPVWRGSSSSPPALCRQVYCFRESATGIGAGSIRKTG
ncbi:MAG: hypothetical protein E5X49_31335 [Mesorhizobium sp.]|nr:MAG: hypothetical protein EOQ28_20530 [Mesorhizobium sp.]RWC03215.1 MAG: hypothetical protein EOQ57_09305 [Mesorhizobium sp.]RWG77150.1 MAG: hypothetical protein EOQ69_29870 [Mesorhizobium sp.]RWG78133.1 MAG: hypothetical protein EOQ70_31140 [Mesorhizobium sp.]RWJ97550.1 MAG: hypothetical protein EOR42_28475 [Mesorhizobium sp.]